MKYEVDIPEDCDYWDYQVKPTADEGINQIVAIFECGDRVIHQHVGYTERSNSEWRDFHIEKVTEGDKSVLIMKI